MSTGTEAPFAFEAYDMAGENILMIGSNLEDGVITELRDPQQNIVIRWTKQTSLEIFEKEATPTPQKKDNHYCHEEDIVNDNSKLGSIYLCTEDTKASQTLEYFDECNNYSYLFVHYLCPFHCFLSHQPSSQGI